MARPAPRPNFLSLAPYAHADLTAPPGVRRIQLAQNELALPASPAAIEAATRALADANLYAENGELRLMDAVAASERLEPSQIWCTAGSMEAIRLVTAAYLGPGDEAVTSAYGYLFFATAVQMAGAALVRVPECGLRPDIDAMLAAVTPATRIVYLVNPGNPTAAMVPASEVERLRRELRDDILLLIDAAYADFVTAHGYESGAALARAGTATLVLRTFSKAHGLAGLRIGWAVGPADVVDVLSRTNAQFTMAAPSIAAAIASLADRGHLAACLEATIAARSWTIDALTRIGFAPLPSETNFVLLPFERDGEPAPDDAAGAYAHLKREGIIVRPMRAYALDHCLRITIGTRSDMEAVVASLAGWRRAAN
ncbi:MAG: aminotransferase class I/II-fold pyridoxal phosphate-dependent enzyme [Rhizobiales bacterium]|nr:aminotransferase class I/II-fold pyridoxal phosphate-dependent enzyme [Hyphomicrobiales bacterium]